MANVTGIHGPGGLQPPKPTEGVIPGRAAFRAHQAPDSVEISTAAKLAMRVRDIPDVRADLVARVKAEIVAGTYETSERIEIAIDRLLEDLFPSNAWA